MWMLHIKLPLFLSWLLRFFENRLCLKSHIYNYFNFLLFNLSNTYVPLHLTLALHPVVTSTVYHKLRRDLWSLSQARRGRGGSLSQSLTNHLCAWGNDAASSEVLTKKRPLLVENYFQTPYWVWVHPRPLRISGRASSWAKPYKLS